MLGLVETVDLVNEDERTAPFVLESLAGAVQGCPQILHPARHGAKRWAGGAVKKSVLEIDADAILGQPLAKILTDHDATMLLAALRGLGPGERKRGLTFNLQIDGVMPTPRPRAIDACIYRSLDPEDRRFYLSVTRTAFGVPQQMARQRDRVTGLIEAVEFTRPRPTAVKIARKSGKAACLAPLVEICKEKELRACWGRTL